MIKKILKCDFLIRCSIIVFAFFPIIPNKIKGLPVILLFLVAAVSAKKQFNWKWLLINSSLFLVYAFSFIYTENYKIGVTKLETGLSILIIPIIFYGFLGNYRIKQLLKSTFYKFFIFSTFIYSMVSYYFIVTDSKTVFYNNWYTNKFRTIITEVPLIGQHPIYASIFLSISIIFFIELVKLKYFKVIHQNIYSFFVIINTSLLFILASKGVIISLFITCFIYVLRTVKKHKVTLILVMIAGLVLFTFNRRLKEAFRFDNYVEINENFSTSIRVGIYKCAIQVIKEEFFLGYGVGDAQHALNLCYANKSNVLLKNRFNSHNQYIDVTIKTGILGLSIFICFLFMNFKKAIKYKNDIVISVLIFYCISLLTENLLVRQSGVILFFFLLSFLNHSRKTKLKVYDNSKLKTLQDT